jgi:hypothetical protein
MSLLFLLWEVAISGLQAHDHGDDGHYPSVLAGSRFSLPVTQILTEDKIPSLKLLH